VQNKVISLIPVTLPHPDLDVITLAVNDQLRGVQLRGVVSLIYGHISGEQK